MNNGSKMEHLKSIETLQYNANISGHMCLFPISSSRSKLLVKTKIKKIRLDSAELKAWKYKPNSQKNNIRPK